MKKEKPTPHDDSGIPELIYGEEEESPIFAMIGMILLIVAGTMMFLL